jgi:hypothetical protein
MSKANTNEAASNPDVSEIIDSIIAEAGQHGFAFVEDEYLDLDDGGEVYNPFVDRENAEMWLREKLLELTKL